MSSKNCSTCLARIAAEDDAPVLAMGAYGTPKLLCDECASLIENMTLGKDYNEISESMDRLTKKMSAANIDDRVAVATVTEILAKSAERAQLIKDGLYDFSLDENEDEESFDEIPEELMETEEDRLLDQKDAEANAKFDKFMNWMWIGVAVAAAGFLAYRLISALF